MANPNPIIARLEVMDSHDRELICWFCDFISECGYERAVDLPTGKWLRDTLKTRQAARGKTDPDFLRPTTRSIPVNNEGNAKT